MSFRPTEVIGDLRYFHGVTGFRMYVPPTYKINLDDIDEKHGAAFVTLRGALWGLLVGGGIVFWIVVAVVFAGSYLGR